MQRKQHYVQIEKELFAVVSAGEQFHHRICGSSTIVVENNLLTSHQYGVQCQDFHNTSPMLQYLLTQPQHYNVMSVHMPHVYVLTHLSKKVVADFCCHGGAYYLLLVGY